MSEEQLLRLQTGYASRDGRFYAERADDDRWHVTDARLRKTVETQLRTLRECRAWMRRRRAARP
jgi:hypothetical protein